jgi:hypothetical protein
MFNVQGSVLLKKAAAEATAFWIARHPSGYDTICRPQRSVCKPHPHSEGQEMLKNALAIVGLAVVLKTGFDVY